MPQKNSEVQVLIVDYIPTMIGLMIFVHRIMAADCDVLELLLESGCSEGKQLKPASLTTGNRLIFRAMYRSSKLVRVFCINLLQTQRNLLSIRKIHTGTAPYLLEKSEKL
ncbi:unnamed protein product [Enterobius vermicularis]|uniref:ANK_REP_REGION domain-containing protein n=1 Tax=Enterobius vermicularis TaxID=51028 RepID=A0A0N4V9Z6_ENTVE|nr:unnamed protein product [Enterobius vermicularis]